jgi:cation transport ATPase
LRAGHVAILRGRFHYFCRFECKRAYLRAQDDFETQRPPSVAPRDVALTLPTIDVTFGVDAPAPVIEAEKTEDSLSVDIVIEPESPPVPAPAALQAPANPVAPRILPQHDASSTERRKVMISDSMAIACGALGALLVLGSSTLLAGGIIGSVVGVLVWVLRVAVRRRDDADEHVLVVSGPPVGAAIASVWALATRDPHASSIALLAGLSTAAVALVDLLETRARRGIDRARNHILSGLDVRARVVTDDHVTEMPASEVRPGEQIVVEAGEYVAVDGVVTAGEASVVPWLDAGVESARREGDPVVAGARVLSSRIRVITAWSGAERAWIKLLSTREGRVDVMAPTPRMLRLTFERGALVAAAICGLAAVASNATAVQVLAAGCAGALAFGATAASGFTSLHIARGHIRALASGIAYKSARAFEQAASATLAVLSAESTILMGEPETVAVESLGALDPERILSLASGAASASPYPIAVAVVRSARTRGVTPESVRNATVRQGLGITALTSGGERLVMGGRALMLEEKISAAVVDTRVSELEADGRSVLLVALGNRLVGLVAAQDGLRPGVRAAVQNLLDAHIEPVLLSGEARQTCEAIGRALDIDHVRPEILPADCGAEVKALAESGSVVAVVGHPMRDDAALGAADVAVATRAAGLTPGEWAVALAGDDPRDAALALTIPRGARDHARLAALFGAAPAVAALLAGVFGVAPIEMAPIAVMIGAVAAAIHAHAVNAS